MAIWQKTDDEWTALLLAVAAGSEPAFARLHTLSSRWLYGVVVRVQGDRDEAQDVLQEVWVRIWLHSAVFDPAKGPARAWLARIAQHGAIDNLRRSRARPALASHLEEGELDPYAPLATPDPAPHDRLVGARTEHAVRCCVRALPTDQREGLHGAYYEGLTHTELALRLDRPLGTVKSLLRRAHAALRPGLAAYR